MKRATVLKSGAAALLFAAGVQFAFAMPESLPPVQQQGDVTFLSGGIGLDESTAIKGVMHQYPLVLEFATSRSGANEYVADVAVQVSDSQGRTILSTTARGPFLLAALPNGRYSVTARHDGQTMRRNITIGRSTHIRELFLWST
jgi:hypothetical protein